MIVDHLHLAKDGIHIYLGVACFLVAISIGRRSPRSYQAHRTQRAGISGA
jgi:hypothetical protein